MKRKAASLMTWIGSPLLITFLVWLPSLQPVAAPTANLATGEIYGRQEITLAQGITVPVNGWVIHGFNLFVDALWAFGVMVVVWGIKVATSFGEEDGNIKEGAHGPLPSRVR